MKTYDPKNYRKVLEFVIKRGYSVYVCIPRKCMLQFEVESNGITSRVEKSGFLKLLARDVALFQYSEKIELNEFNLPNNIHAKLVSTPDGYPVKLSSLLISTEASQRYGDGER